jgi:hypothetical protein
MNFSLKKGPSPCIVVCLVERENATQRLHEPRCCVPLHEMRVISYVTRFLTYIDASHILQQKITVHSVMPRGDVNRRSKICLKQDLDKRETHFYRIIVLVLRIRIENSKTACDSISCHFAHDRGAKKKIFRVQRWLEGLIFPGISRAVSRLFKPGLRTIRYSMFYIQNSKLTHCWSGLCRYSRHGYEFPPAAPCYRRMVANYRSVMLSERRLFALLIIVH